jgi:hypothetical protein
VVNCDRSAARPPCLMMLKSEFLLRCYSDPSTAKSYEPFPFANMAPNSPCASPLIPSEK